MQKSKIIKRVFVFLFAAIFVVMLFLSVFTKGFTDWRFGKELPAVSDLNNNVVVVPQDNSGVMTLSVMRAPEATFQPDDGFEVEMLTITATVSPDDSADNSGLNWSMEFKDPESVWASGKTLSDYLTLTPSGTDTAGSKTVYVQCLQPFGEQVVITATSQDNPDITASCTADFAQRVESATLKFGDLPVNLGGDTNVKWELNPNGVGEGGAVNVTMEKSEVYSLAEDFTYTVTAESSFTEESYFTLDGKGVTTTPPGDITQTGIVFDHALMDTMHLFILGRNGDFIFSEATVGELIPYFSNITNGHVLNIRLTISGSHSKTEYTSRIMVTGYTNSSVISNVEFDTSGLVF